MAGRYDFIIRSNESFDRVIQWLDENENVVALDGYTASLRVRPYPGSSTVLLKFLSSGAGVNDGTITVTGGAASQLELKLTAANAALLTAWKEPAVYDLIV